MSTQPSTPCAASPSPPRRGLTAAVEARRAAFTLRVSLQVRPDRPTALLGPNGAGKSTALRVLAGLLRPTAGRVELDGRLLDDVRAGRHLPPERRSVGVLWQDYRLFPHLSAADNVAFGLRTRGVARTEAARRAHAWLERVGLGEHAKAKPAALSGGQAQRVALARALAPEPALLLLDEPLAALDARTRQDVRAELRTHLADYHGATVLVTHDPLDAMVLAADVVVLEGGRAVQQGPVAEVARRPQTEYVARLVGLNLYRGVRAAGVVRLPDGTQIATTATPGLAPADGTEVLVAFPPGAVSVFLEPPQGSPRNVFAARVRDMEMQGGIVRLRLDGPLPALADVTPAAVSELGLGPGRAIWMAVKATETAMYPG